MIGTAIVATHLLFCQIGVQTTQQEMWMTGAWIDAGGVKQFADTMQKVPGVLVMCPDAGAKP
jgi:hypothetical protein